MQTCGRTVLEMALANDDLDTTDLLLRQDADMSKVRVAVV